MGSSSIFRARTVVNMNFELPSELKAHIQSIDSFIQSSILSLQNANDNNRFFDHRREHARTDWDQNGNPRPEWETLLSKTYITTGYQNQRKDIELLLKYSPGSYPR